MSEELELNRDDYITRMYNRNMTDHSHCSDPDHWGCEKCEPEEEEDETKASKN
jgi:hypothetical protein